jgi:hypothetical protein
MEYVFLIAFAWWFVKFEPLQFIFDKLFVNFPINNLSIAIHSALGCPKCIGFWSTLIITGEFFTACVVSLCSYIIDLCLQRLDR